MTIPEGAKPIVSVEKRPGEMGVKRDWSTAVLLATSANSLIAMLLAPHGPWRVLMGISMLLCGSQAAFRILIQRRRWRG